jgi:endonuclease/exonuclease/phosphatase family metal-dependent hydrolase
MIGAEEDGAAGDENAAGSAVQPRGVMETAQKTLSVITANVDGLGSYELAPAERIRAILQVLLAVSPDVILLQEVYGDEMLSALKGQCPQGSWQICRQHRLDEPYFNVTLVRRNWGGAKVKTHRFKSSPNGRHLVTAYTDHWGITNVHAESGGRQRDIDERGTQLLHMSRKHETEDSRGVCVLAGDFNMREGEEHCLRVEGWRDVWLERPTHDHQARGDQWTWRKAASSARYDRIFVHDAEDVVVCEQTSRVPGIWPSLSDHVALHATLRRRSARVRTEAPCGGVQGLAASKDCMPKARSGAPQLAPKHIDTRSSGEGKVAAGQCKVDSDESKVAAGQNTAASGLGTQSKFQPMMPQKQMRVVVAANAVYEFLDDSNCESVREARSFPQKVRECLKGVSDFKWEPPAELPADRALPSWDAIPTEGGFKVMQLGGRSGRRSATSEDKRQQCENYARYLLWAEKCCGVSEAEFKACLTTTAATKKDSRGDAAIPFMLRVPNHTEGNRVPFLYDTVLRCCAVGLPKLVQKAYSTLTLDHQAGLGGDEWAAKAVAEFQRLLRLSEQELLSECGKVAPCIRELKFPAVLQADKTSKLTDLTRSAPVSTCVDAVFRLFQLWMFAELAELIGARGEWQRLTRDTSWIAKLNVPKRFELDLESFEAGQVQKWLAPTIQQTQGQPVDFGKLKVNKQGLLAAAWLHLIWEASRAEVSRRFGDTQRVCSGRSFSIPFLYDTLFSSLNAEKDEVLNAILNDLEQFELRAGRPIKTTDLGRLRFFTWDDRGVFWRHAVQAWNSSPAWPASVPESSAAAGQRRVPAATGNRCAPEFSAIPEVEVQSLPDGAYKWRGHRAPPGPFREAYEILNKAWQEQQYWTWLAQQKAEERKAAILARGDVDAEQRPGSIISLSHSRHKPIFQGRIFVQADEIVFEEESTWMRVHVAKPTDAHTRAGKGAYQSKLYEKLRAEHIKHDKLIKKEARKKLVESNRPTKISELTRKGAAKGDNKKVVYAWQGFEVNVTPRTHRGELSEEASSLRQTRAREFTPQRALRKMTEKVKRAAAKQMRGELERIVACDDSSQPRDVNDRCPAAAKLDEPVVLEHLRASFDFLLSARLHYCQNCDEEWPVFDAKWPQGGVDLCGPLAGKCETIARGGFMASSTKPWLCTRCATNSAYRTEYSYDNGQHLGERDEALDALTWYESLLVALVHPVISVVTLMSTGLLCYAGHICNYYLKTFEWFSGLPNVVRDKKYFLVKRRKSIRASDSHTRHKKPTTANRQRLFAAICACQKRMPKVYENTHILQEELAKFPEQGELEMEEAPLEQEDKVREHDLKGEVQVDQEMFRVWLQAGEEAAAGQSSRDAGAVPATTQTFPCARALRCYGIDLQGFEDLRGAVTSESIWELICRLLEQEEVASHLGTSTLAQVLVYLLEDRQLPLHWADLLYDGMQQDLLARGKSVQTHKDDEAMRSRWLKQLIHQELDAARESWMEGATEITVDLDVEGPVEEAENASMSKAAEAEATKVLASLKGPPCPEESAGPMDVAPTAANNHPWEEPLHDVEAWDLEAGPAVEWNTVEKGDAWWEDGDTSVADPASTTGNVKAGEVMADASGHTAADRKDASKPLVDPPEFGERIRDLDKKPRWIPGAFPTIFQNETGDQG